MDFRDTLTKKIREYGRKKFIRDSKVSAATVFRIGQKSQMPTPLTLKRVCEALEIPESEKNLYLLERKKLKGVTEVKDVTENWVEELVRIIKNQQIAYKDFVRVGISSHTYWMLTARKRPPKPSTIKKILELLKLEFGKGDWFTEQARLYTSKKRKRAVTEHIVTEEAEEAKDVIKEILGEEPKEYVDLGEIGIDNLITRTKKVIVHLQFIKTEAARMQEEYSSWLRSLVGHCGKIAKMREELRKILYTREKNFGSRKNDK